MNRSPVVVVLLAVCAWAAALCAGLTVKSACALTHPRDAGMGALNEDDAVLKIWEECAIKADGGISGPHQEKCIAAVTPHTHCWHTSSFQYAVINGESFQTCCICGLTRGVPRLTQQGPCRGHGPFTMGAMCWYYSDGGELGRITE